MCSFDCSVSSHSLTQFPYLYISIVEVFPVYLKNIFVHEPWKPCLRCVHQLNGLKKLSESDIHPLFTLPKYLYTGCLEKWQCIWSLLSNAASPSQDRVYSGERRRLSLTANASVQLRFGIDRIKNHKAAGRLQRERQMSHVWRIRIIIKDEDELLGKLLGCWVYQENTQVLPSSWITYTFTFQSCFFRNLLREVETIPRRIIKTVLNHLGFGIEAFSI